MTNLDEEVTVFPAYLVDGDKVTVMVTNDRGGVMWERTTPAGDISASVVGVLEALGIQSCGESPQRRDLAAILDEAAVTERWGAHGTARGIEGWRTRLRADERPLNTLEGGSGPYDDQTIGKAAGGSKNRVNCYRLAQLAYEYGAGAIVELGTNVGISSAYLALGAQEADPEAVVLTGDVSPARISVAKTLHESVELENVRYYPGLFEVTVEPMLADAGTVGLCFIDGDHTYDGTWRYYRQVLPVMRPGSMIVFDDIDWSDGMRQFWSEASAGAQSTKLDGVGYIAVP